MRIVNPIFWGVGAIVFLIAALGFVHSAFENLDASDQMVVQYPSGQLEIFTTPGWKPQWFGRVTKYKKRTNYDFLSPARNAKKGAEDNSIEVRFNDAGHGQISGSVAYELPVDRATFLRLHTLYGSQGSVERQLVAPVVNKVVYMTGPLMSSRESYAERRNELLSLIDDQLQHGVVRTRTLQTRAPDAITGQEKSVQVVEIVRDASGALARQDASPLSEFKIKTFNLAINGVIYDQSVEDQIKSQQQMSMAVQTAIVEAKKAEQAAITAEQTGKAEAAKAKWDQEVIKAKEVTAGEQRLAVARLDAESAEQTKRRLILEGEGEGAKRRAIIAGDNALDKRLEAWLSAQKYYADAIKGYQGNWVPSVVMGGAGATNAAGGTQLLELIGIKAARDLALDMEMGAKK
jgi:regulator of protease activity HflC (stomatin/prohibitin superfamily)